MFKRAVFLLVLFLLSSAAMAGPTSILYHATDLGSNRWQYEYTVTNHSLSQGISEFTIWFDYGFYDNIAIEMVGTSSGLWDELVSQPVYIAPFDPYDGMYDALTLSVGIGVGQAVGGFSASFDWLGAGTPSSQVYQIINPQTFETINQGRTMSDEADIVPVPGAFVLGFIGLGMIRLRKK